MASYGQIISLSFGATIVHLVADVLIPMIADKAEFKLPPILEGTYLKSAGLLLVGYFIAISLLYVIKRAFFRN